MRIYTDRTVDTEFKDLGDLGFTGTLNDRQFAFLRDAGYTNSLADMMYQRRLNDSLSLTGVEAALAGSGGFALDTTDLSTLFQDVAKTIPITAPGQTIGAIRTKWGSAQYDVIQVSAGARPSFDGGDGVVFDASDDHLVMETNIGGFLNNKPAAFACVNFTLDALAVQASLFGWSGTSSTQPRFGVRVLTTGAVELTARTIDASTQTILTSATGLVSVGGTNTISAMVDYAGTRSAQVWVNGTLAIDGTLTQAASNTSATNSSRALLGRNIAAIEVMDGTLRRMVFADKLMTAGELEDIEGWVAQ